VQPTVAQIFKIGQYLVRRAVGSDQRLSANMNFRLSNINAFTQDRPSVLTSTEKGEGW